MPLCQGCGTDTKWYLSCPVCARPVVVPGAPVFGPPPTPAGAWGTGAAHPQIILRDPHEKAREYARAARKRRIRSVVAFLFFALLAGAIAFVVTRPTEDERAVEALQGTWNTVTTQSQRFTIDLPGKVQMDDMTNMMGGTPGTALITYTGRGNAAEANVGIAVVEIDLVSAGMSPDLANQNFDNLFVSIADGAVKKYGGDIVMSQFVASDLGNAGRFTGIMPDQGYRVSGFVVIHKSMLVVLYVLLPEDERQLTTSMLDRAVASLEPVP